MKKLIKNIAIVFALTIILVSCEELNKELNNSGLSEDDIVKGLKTALEVGADSAVTIVSDTTKGYFRDEAIKIWLPPQASIITDNISAINEYSSVLGVNVDLNSYVDKVILSMNRAAEYAADSAKPILKSAITSLSISDGLSILNGENPAATKSVNSFDSTAATNYLKSTTYSQLVNAYKTPIDGELNKDVLGFGFTTNGAWSSLTLAYNEVASTAQSILDADNLLPFSLLPPEEKTTLQKITPINYPTLGQYVTEKALTGLFVKVGDQERSIRRNPLKWASETVGAILEKVFGKN